MKKGFPGHVKRKLVKNRAHFKTKHLKQRNQPRAGLRLDRMNVTEDGILYDRTPLGALADQPWRIPETNTRG